MTRSRKEKREQSPPKAIPVLSGFRIDVKRLRGGRKSVLICDCEEIVSYSHEMVSFRHHGEIVTIQGHELWCRTYGNHVAEVLGKVGAIMFGAGGAVCEN